MKVKYCAGKALPGEEKRTFSLDYQEIAGAIGTVTAGTFNVFFHLDLDLGVPTLTTEHYDFWSVEVSTAGMIKRDEPGIPGYVIRVYGENNPPNFAEIVSPIHIRTALKKTNWPDFPIEVAFRDMLNSPEDTDNQVKIAPDARKRVRNPPNGADSA